MIKLSQEPRFHNLKEYDQNLNKLSSKSMLSMCTICSIIMKFYGIRNWLDYPFEFGQGVFWQIFHLFLTYIKKINIRCSKRNSSWHTLKISSCSKKKMLLPRIMKFFLQEEYYLLRQKENLVEVKRNVFLQQENVILLKNVFLLQKKFFFFINVFSEIKAIL